MPRARSNGSNGRSLARSSLPSAPLLGRKNVGRTAPPSLATTRWDDRWQASAPKSTCSVTAPASRSMPLSHPGKPTFSTQVETVLEQVAIPRASGRRRRRPRRLAADRAYDAQRIRHFLRLHGICPVIPPKHRTGKRKRGRRVTYNRDHYRRRSTIEQCVGWLKECRAVATRYEKLALNYLGLVKLAFIERYLRLLTRIAAPG